MRSFAKFLPWCFVVWYARRHCERMVTDGLNTVQPFANGPVLSVLDYGPNVAPLSEPRPPGQP